MERADGGGGGGGGGILKRNGMVGGLKVARGQIINTRGGIAF